jgi:hypothetical protein
MAKDYSFLMLALSIRGSLAEIALMSNEPSQWSLIDKKETKPLRGRF